jgi:hypothetical protein
MDRWNRLHGYAHILPFDPNQGTARYCAKYLSKDAGDWDLSDNLNRFRTSPPVLFLG